jgi:hypothetical protein
MEESTLHIRKTQHLLEIFLQWVLQGKFILGQMAEQ